MPSSCWPVYACYLPLPSFCSLFCILFLPTLCLRLDFLVPSCVLSRHTTYAEDYIRLTPYYIVLPFIDTSCLLLPSFYICLPLGIYHSFYHPGLHHWELSRPLLEHVFVHTTVTWFTEAHLNMTTDTTRPHHPLSVPAPPLPPTIPLALFMCLDY